MQTMTGRYFLVGSAAIIAIIFSGYTPVCAQPSGTFQTELQSKRHAIGKAPKMSLTPRGNQVGTQQNRKMPGRHIQPVPSNSGSGRPSLVLLIPKGGSLRRPVASTSHRASLNPSAQPSSVAQYSGVRSALGGEGDRKTLRHLINGISPSGNKNRPGGCRRMQQGRHGRRGKAWRAEVPCYVCEGMPHHRGQVACIMVVLGM
jgi:hypothetical protein